MTLFDFGVDLWIELIISNELSNQDIFNLTTTCKFFSQFLKNEKLLQYLKIHFGTILEREGKEWTITSISWNQTSRVVAVSTKNGEILIWNASSGKKKVLVAESHGGTDPYLTFHPLDPHLLAVWTVSGICCLWDIEKAEIRLKFQSETDHVFCLAFEPQGRFLASGGVDNAVLIWNIETGKCEKALNGSSASCVTTGLAFSADGQKLAASTDQAIFVWDFETFQLVHTIQQNRKSLISDNFVQFIGNEIVSISPMSQFVSFYDSASGKEKNDRGFKSNRWHHYRIAVHPYRKMIALGGSSGFEVWDIELKKNFSEPTSTVTDLCFSPNGRALAVSVSSESPSFKTHIHIFDTNNYR